MRPLAATSINQFLASGEKQSRNVSRHSWQTTVRKTPYITPNMNFSSGKGVVRGRRGQPLELALQQHRTKHGTFQLLPPLGIQAARHQHSIERSSTGRSKKGHSPSWCKSRSMRARSRRSSWPVTVCEVPSWRAAH